MGIIDEIHFDKNNKYLYTGNIDGNNRLWSFDNMNEICQKTDPAGHYGIVAPFTADSKHTFFANTLWKNQLFQFPYYHDNETSKYQYNNDGTLLIAVSRETIRLVNAINNSVIKEISKDIGAISHICFDQKSELVSISTLDYLTLLWNLKTDKIFRLKHKGWKVGCSVFVENNTILATANSDSTVVLWDVHSGNEVGKLMGHTDFVEYLTYCPQSHHLASGSSDGIRIWDIRTRKQVDLIKGEKYNSEF